MLGAACSSNTDLPVPNHAAQELTHCWSVYTRHPLPQWMAAYFQGNHLDVEQICQLYKGLLVCSRERALNISPLSFKNSPAWQIYVHISCSNLDSVPLQSAKHKPKEISTTKQVEFSVQAVPLPHSWQTGLKWGQKPTKTFNDLAWWDWPISPSILSPDNTKQVALTEYVPCYLEESANKGSGLCPVLRRGRIFLHRELGPMTNGHEELPTAYSTGTKNSLSGPQ